MKELHYRRLDSMIEAVARGLISPPGGVRLPWWPHMTKIIGGLRRGELTLICAPTGAGKTQLLANFACQFLIQRTPTFCAPVETGGEDFIVRVLSVLEASDWNTGEAFSVEQVSGLINAHIDTLKDAPFYFGDYDSRVAIEEMEGQLRYQARAHGIHVALLDNLNFFLKVTRSSEQIIEMDEAVRMLVQVAKQELIHIILICHPKKTGDDGRVLSEFDLKGSSSLVQEASNVMLWNRPARDDEFHLITDREAVFKKMRRRGIAVNQPFWFSFKGGRFVECEPSSNPGFIVPLNFKNKTHKGEV